jgi:Fe-S cluster biogenesis protein NfuA/nitrite reductase/ring-hydroxylating ferredoxin subunit
VDTTSPAARIDQLLGAFADDPVLTDRAEELVRTVVEFYDEGLGRMMELLVSQADVVSELTADKIVAGMLVLHDLHPRSTYERVSEALDQVRPYLGSHAGDVDLLDVAGGVVRLRLAGNCNGCPSSSATVTLAIERAIEDAAPEVIRVEVEGVAAPPRPRSGGGPGGRTLLPMLGAPAVTTASPSSPASTWIALDASTTVAPGRFTTITIGGSDTILANIDGSLYAYHDRCPACRQPIHTGTIIGHLLECGCGERFDLRRAGADSLRPDLHLEPLPLLDEDGTVRVAVLVEALA